MTSPLPDSLRPRPLSVLPVLRGLSQVLPVAAASCEDSCGWSALSESCAAAPSATPPSLHVCVFFYVRRRTPFSFEWSTDARLVLRCFRNLEREINIA